MRKLLFAGVTLAALGVIGPAEAADLPLEPVYKGGPLIVPVYDWTGFYLGISVGFLPWDHVMLFVTGGAAFGEIESNPTVTNTVQLTNNGVPFGAPFTQIASGTAINTHAGWTVGGGSEWVLSGPWTAKLEYLFVDLGTVTNTLVGGGAVPTVVASSHVRDNIVRIGLNYRFGGPVSARY